MADENYYAILQVPRNATDDVITHAYRQQALQCHPDKHRGSLEAEERFKRVSQAYQVLSNPDRRAHYDQQCLSSMERRNSIGKDTTPIVWTKKYGWSSFNISFGWIGEPDLPDVPAAAASTAAADPHPREPVRQCEVGQPSQEDDEIRISPPQEGSASEDGALAAPTMHPADGASPRVEECIGLPSQRTGTCGSGMAKGALANPFSGFREVLGIDEVMGRFIDSLRVTSCGGEEERRTPGGPWAAEEIFNPDEVKMARPGPRSSRSPPVESW
eukprot:CAMPEP_0178389454 /NCGR_PEP_ID=MMETSP0689_2-20121128/10124_1 /TAXON_ID=160604 /ORGANISM="Amphidinium massartii, Strain CS-259" /LENGTH=271 /DNA_ID=CAMNT_0020009903 /DNA_START=125 /DNA_END=940 /DNA_ORIENTATION=-